MCRWEGGGEIPKGGRAGRARSLGIWPRGGEIPRDLAPGGEITGGGGEIPGTPEKRSSHILENIWNFVTPSSRNHGIMLNHYSFCVFNMFVFVVFNYMLSNISGHLCHIYKT